MGLVTLSTQNRLFWLGRYSERVYKTIEFTSDQYDRLIDGNARNHVEFCSQMGIPCICDNSEEFAKHYMFDVDYAPSIASSVENMLGNGMVLRAIITTPALAYLQMAKNAMDMAKNSEGPKVELQWVQDDIMAFVGSLTRFTDEEVENTVRLGAFVERISLMLRLDYQLEKLGDELKKLLNNLYKVEIETNQASLDVLLGKVMENKETDKYLLLNSVENLFVV